ncbi:MAG: TRAP transporter small permease [Pseudotabrizicola sp.]|uniref:TRAP transporter small permease n=1 Tax=Pseudotabrizicola sp. TaxID=2939647 RepID=UPI0027179820|nr:TRAP transporter small permease [Pseudotabrizicola sp.]MDO9636953.1 TRAP transporter small permease [Pseudotabrizicola sp.]
MPVKRLIILLRTLTTGFAVTCFCFMVLAVTVQVIGRYLLPIKLGNAVESAAFAQVWLACIGAGLALRHGAVFAVDALPATLPLWAARIVSVLIAAGSLVFLAVLVYGGILLVRQGASQTSPTLLMPMWIVFLAVPVGMSFMALEVILRVVDRWADPFAPVFETEMAE